MPSPPRKANGRAREARREGSNVLSCPHMQSKNIPHQPPPVAQDPDVRVVVGPLEKRSDVEGLSGWNGMTDDLKR